MVAQDGLWPLVQSRLAPFVNIRLGMEKERNAGTLRFGERDRVRPQRLGKCQSG